MENAERPDDPFTLFNLGSVYQELGRPADALPLLQRSLERSHPGDSIVRKLYALIVQCHRRLGQAAEARSACRAGRAVYPADVELLFQESLAARESGDLPGAEACLLRLLATREREPDHFASVDPGLTGYKARHNLAVVYRDQGRTAEAEAQWRAAVAERPDFVPAWLGLGEILSCLGALGRPGGGLAAARRIARRCVRGRRTPRPRPPVAPRVRLRPARSGGGHRARPAGASATRLAHPRPAARRPRPPRRRACPARRARPRPPPPRGAAQPRRPARHLTGDPPPVCHGPDGPDPTDGARNNSRAYALQISVHTYLSALSRRRNSPSSGPSVRLALTAAPSLVWRSCAGVAWMRR